MREMWVIAKREFMERVRSKWFVVMTVLWPFFMIGMLVIPALIGGQGTAGAKVRIIDKSGEVGDLMATQLAMPPPLGLGWQTEKVAPDIDEKLLRAKIRTNEINGYVVIPQDVLDGGSVTYNGDNASNQTVTLLFSMVKPVDVNVKHTTGEEEGKSGVMTFLIGYMIAFFIYIAITLYGFGVMRSVVTEKTSRIVELLVSAATPRAMMSGKIIGVGLAGLTQIAIWFAFGWLVTTQQDAILGLFGAEPKAGSILPSLTLGQIGTVLAFFLLGYLFYSAMYAAVGAMVSNEQDTQQAQLPITFLLVIGIMAIMSVTNDPRGSTASVMTMVPFWSPMLMPLRYFLGGATLGQVGMSLGILAVSTVIVARVAAKIYRVGILMYGKRPSLREVVRWLRY